MQHQSSNRFEPFAEGWIQKNARCMGPTRADAKKPHGPNFHLRIGAESQQNQPISEANGDW